VWIGEDEAYPVYSVELVERIAIGKPQEVDEKTLKRWRRVLKQYEQVQAELSEYYNRPEEMSK